ncbi:uncharacterized protein DUF922 [Oceanihabitans sediminis]|uniref:DUF922 domain-containing protein n=1 Tax=Oceanihabitans sediminis TaxID=1812012 RepID=A0A368P3V9_9FLAO|nr:DUF922 domain-containing protein [Oceanihabitans sediminis]MDX1774395.1 DUF922 domain-containing protein [Oceanihabitans sediminis]RBP29802.1 uncharacterized protein DUF922 [Oceanihabitans sediminis]RCU57143.1 DUF922 domain-containing protein [Oceanihabitans sediminis]
MYFKLLFIGFCLLNIQTDVATITWSEDYNLTWSDFKGPIETASDAVAITASGISFGYAIKSENKEVSGFKTKILAHFYPEKSWYKAALADEHILAHEQFHFNITELYARKFRERVARLQPSTDVSFQLEALHKEINRELAAKQIQYDAETDFSRDFEQQAIWEKYIEQELAKLATYKSEE